MGIKCLDIVDVEAFAAGQVKPRRARAIQAHVARCDKCRAMLDEFQANEAMLAKLRASHQVQLRSKAELERLSITESRVEATLRQT